MLQRSMSDLSRQAQAARLRPNVNGMFAAYGTSKGDKFIFDAFA
jgi:hypothetical protein